MTQDEKYVRQLTRQLRKRMVDNSWYWRGTEFTNFGRFGISSYTAYVRFTATLSRIRAGIDLQDDYGLPDESNGFEGEDAMSDAIEWTATKLLELYHKIAARTAPYVAGYNQYLKAVHGINN